MKDIRLDYSRNAEKFFEKHEDIREEFKRDVVKLITGYHPEQVNLKPLKGKLKGYSRIAIGGYRVIYKKSGDEIIVVSVIYAGSRGDIYKHLGI